MFDSTSYDGLFVDGDWIATREQRTTAVTNPATATVIGSVPEGDPADLDVAVAAARRAFDEGPWPRLSARERARLLHRFADVLDAHRKELAAIITAESGALPALVEGTHFGIGFGRFRHAVDLAATQLDSVTPLRTGPGSVLGATALVYKPRGVAGLITPFNFPLYLNLCKLGPALAMGNTVVLKPSPLTPLEGLVLGAAAAEAGLPPGVVNVVTGGVAVGEALVADPRVDLISFTGSSRVGSDIMALAARSLTPVVLELGGKSALIVREDAAVADAANLAYNSFTLHAGQGCVLLTRHVVHRRLVGDFLDALAERAAHTVVGDPTDPATTMGPLISETQRGRVADYVAIGAAEGGEIVTGGEPVERPGYFFAPTVIHGVTPKARVAQEEIFGPVAVVLPFDTDDEAVAIANDSRFGLSGGVVGADAGKAWEIARRLNTGSVRINGGGTALDADAPVTGWGASGIGAEHGLPGLLEFAQPQSIAFRVR
ncbi:aldehyde dehydrogenase family protein [Nocardia sp. alder85J]|uniref:aldehyde dehydrogenase family protein n=1 Tax=Nocardia sp. alder85J TaxID=2862949 RepID=UPI001CD32650|nr:aldehyde dehydrogenase family protein [Nocardia sp. alder85J]MCX4092374.1 aldehyde dehydrogenase family protein [Nocardia sp. alder85J]